MCKKTKMCRFFAQASCNRGENCRFAHDPEELVAKPDLSRTKLCHILRATGRCTHPNCAFAHTKGELRFASAKGNGSIPSLTAPMQARLSIAPMLDVQLQACEHSGKRIQDVEDEMKRAFLPSPHLRQESAPVESPVCIKNTFITVESAAECRLRRSKSAPPCLVQLGDATELVLRVPVESSWGIFRPSSPPPRARKPGNTSLDVMRPMA